MTLYYKIWTDLIILIQKNPLRANDWKIFTLLFVGSANAIKLMFFFAIFQRYILKFTFYDINLPFNNQFIKTTLTGFILYWLPPIIFNYWLIFYKNKYVLIVEKYKDSSKNYFLIYFLSSLFVPLLILIIALIINRLTW